MANNGNIDRRTLLKLTGAGAAGATADCLGLGGNGGNGDEDWDGAVSGLNLGEDWQARRIGATDDWSIEQRRQVPDRQNDTTWTDSGAFQSAVENNVWAPPDGWDDTAAGDVDSITILNHGAANMEFDPATLAAHELFTEQTGIDIEVIEIGVDQANTREQQFLSSEEPSPHAFNVDGILVPQFVQQGYLEVTDGLYPEGGYEPYIPALQSLVRWDLDASREGTHTYGYPNIGEASMGHLRPDLVEEQGIDPSRFEGEWTWDLLEELGEAFAGTDVNAFAYYAGTSTYLAYSFRELLFQQGGSMVQDDGTVVMNLPEAVRVIQKMKEWRDAGYVPSDVIPYGEGDIVDLYASGQLAYTTAFSDFIPRLLQQYEAGTEYQVVVPRAANAGPSPTQAGLVAPNTTSINRFVAGFIGEPSMNFFPVTTHPEGDRLRVDADGFSLRLPAEVADAVAAWDGDTDRLELGIRPEAFEDAALVERAVPDGEQFTAHVAVVEPMGPNTDLALRPADRADEDEAEFTARVANETDAAAGETIDLAVDTSEIHLFDPKTGANLLA